MMEVRVLTTVTVPQVRVMYLIVVVVKEDPVGALIVIQMVTVQHVVPIIINLTLSVMPAVVAKQVLLDRHRRLLVLHRKKVMEVRVLTTVIVPQVHVVFPIVVVVKEDPVDALIVIQMVTVQHVVPIITSLVTSVMPVVAVKQVHLVRLLLLLVLLLKKVMEVRVQVIVNALQVLAKAPTVAVPRENRWVAMTAIPVVTALLVMLITTSLTRSATSATVGRQVLLDPQATISVPPPAV